MSKPKIAFWLTRDKADGLDPDYIEQWEGAERPRYGQLPAVIGGIGWFQGDADRGGFADDAPPAKAASHFGVTVIPEQGQAIPYYITAGKPVQAK